MGVKVMCEYCNDVVHKDKIILFQNKGVAILICQKCESIYLKIQYLTKEVENND